MAYHNRLFSTKDGDYDEATNGECTQWYRGGWWYGACFFSGANLNGPHQPIIPPPPTPTANQIEWFNGGDYVYQPYVDDSSCLLPAGNMLTWLSIQKLQYGSYVYTIP